MGNGPVEREYTYIQSDKEMKKEYVYARSDREMKRTSVEHLDFFCIDLIAVEISLAAAWQIHRWIAPGNSAALWNMSMALPVFHWFLLLLLDPYRGILQRGYLRELAAVLKLYACSFFMIMFFFYFLHAVPQPDRIQIMIYLLVVIPVTYVFRFIRKFALKRRYNNSDHARQILVVATEARAREMIGEITSSAIRNYQFFGLAVVDRSMVGEKIENVLVTADRDGLIEYAKTNIVDEVFINLPEEAEYKLQLPREFLDMGISVHISMDAAYQKLPNLCVENMFGYDVMTTSLSPNSLRRSLLKRLMDIAGGVVGCFITLVLAIVIGPIIFLKSPGPIFFTQNRVGKNGRIFKMYKFRSMYMDAEERKKELMDRNKIKDGMMFKIDDDPRIIKGIGHFIRKTSIDEFPQFFNVLKGEMSMVGTRPPTLDEYKLYSPGQKKRLAMAPGITGLWQLSGRSNITDFDQVVRLDMEYIENWDIYEDIKIIFKTLVYIVKGEGAV